ncbi:hypothetical protein ACNH6B_09285 [Shewanella basaltis]|uniref:hypothetical protein n=1 Tax=Shewanella basaltis TaxID=472183 RepID=UPI003AB02669
MKHILINDFKLKQPKLDTPKYLQLEKVKLHRARVLESANQIFQILNAGHEIVGIDCEMFEFDQSKTTEIGIGYITQFGLRVEHIIISDYYKLRNKKRVPDNKDNFIYGKSIRMTLKQAQEYVKNIFINAKYIYGHALKNDLKQLGVNTAGQLKFDTSTLHTRFTVAKDGIHTTKKTRLSTLCEIYAPHLKSTPYHNAGNDIYVTGAVLKAQGDPDNVVQILGHLDEQHMIQRYHDDEIKRLLAIIPSMKLSINSLMEKSGLTFEQMFNDQTLIDSILSMHQNIYRRMHKYGDINYWSERVNLGVLDEFFKRTKLIPYLQVNQTE